METPEDDRSVLSKAVDTALIPLRSAISKPAQKAYLSTFLFAFASLALFAISTVAYTLFYYNYVPQVGVERVIHLQFGDGHPQGTASLSSSLTSLQPYDITLYLHLPRTPNNLAAGNFMLDLSLHSHSPSPSPSPSPSDPSLIPATSSSPNTPNTSASVLARSRRPAILTYTSPIVGAAKTLSGLPWHVMGWRKESEVLAVSMFEGVEFARGGRNVPGWVKVVVEAEEKMQFYEVGVKIVARFRGLRWILYNHRVLSYLFFTTTFWFVSMSSSFLAWVVLSSYFSSSTTKPKSEDHDLDAKAKIKTEPSEYSDEPFDPLSTEDLSDTSRTFPTLGRQMLLRYTGRHDAAKREEEEARVKEEEIERTTGIQPLIAEADDEDDEDFGGALGRDSGVGTSLEEGDRRGVQRRKALFGAGNRG